jgi:hypothetical protein
MSPDRDRRSHEIELLAFIHPAHHDQSGHNRILQAILLRYFDEWPAARLRVMVLRGITCQ